MCWILILIKLQVVRFTALLKRDSNTGAFCEYCEIYKNDFFYRTPPAVASANSVNANSVNHTKQTLT